MCIIYIYSYNYNMYTIQIIMWLLYYSITITSSTIIIIIIIIIIIVTTMTTRSNIMNIDIMIVIKFGRSPGMQVLHLWRPWWPRSERAERRARRGFQVFASWLRWSCHTSCRSLKKTWLTALNGEKHSIAQLLHMLQNIKYMGAVIFCGDDLSWLPLWCCSTWRNFSWCCFDLQSIDWWDGSNNPTL